MKKTIKLLALILTMAMLTALAACGGDSQASLAPETEAPVIPTETAAPESESTPEPEPAGVSYPLTDEGAELTIFFMSNPMVVEAYMESSNVPGLRVAEEATGVHLVTQGVMPWAANEMFNIMINSGDSTDLIGQFATMYTAGSDNAIEEEVIYDLAPWMETCAPDYLTALETYADGIKSCTTDMGHMPEVGAVSMTPLVIDEGLMMRKDWLDGLGLDSPVTYEDMKEALMGFKTEYGSKGMMLMGTGVFGKNFLAGGYNINAYQVIGFMSEYAFYVVDGEVRHGYEQPEFKEYLSMLADWYAEGLINPDTLLLEADWLNPDHEKYINNGDVGLFYKSMSDIGALENSNVDPNCEITAVSDPVINEGDTIHVRPTVAQDYGLGGGVSITTSCEDPEMALKWLNWWFTEDGVMAGNYGEEGTTYNMVDGKPAYTDMIMKHEQGPFMAWNLYCNSATGIYAITDRLNVAYSEKELAAPQIWMSNTDSAYNYPLAASMTADEGSDFNSLMSEINTYASENILKFIMGEKSLDDFDAFVEQINSMGLQETIGLKQAAYDRYITK